MADDGQLAPLPGGLISDDDTREAPIDPPPSPPSYSSLWDFDQQLKEIEAMKEVMSPTSPILGRPVSKGMNERSAALSSSTSFSLDIKPPGHSARRRRRAKDELLDGDLHSDVEVEDENDHMNKIGAKMVVQDESVRSPASAHTSKSNDLPSPIVSGVGVTNPPDEQVSSHPVKLEEVLAHPIEQKTRRRVPRKRPMAVAKGSTEDAGPAMSPSAFLIDDVGVKKEPQQGLSTGSVPTASSSAAAPALDTSQRISVFGSPLIPPSLLSPLPPAEAQSHRTAAQQLARFQQHINHHQKALDAHSVVPGKQRGLHIDTMAPSSSSSSMSPSALPMGSPVPAGMTSAGLPTGGTPPGLSGAFAAMQQPVPAISLPLQQSLPPALPQGQSVQPPVQPPVRPPAPSLPPPQSSQPLALDTRALVRQGRAIYNEYMQQVQQLVAKGYVDQQKGEELLNVRRKELHLLLRRLIDTHASVLKARLHLREQRETQKQLIDFLYLHRDHPSRQLRGYVDAYSDTASVGSTGRTVRHSLSPALGPRSMSTDSTAVPSPMLLESPSVAAASQPGQPPDDALGSSMSSERSHSPLFLYHLSDDIKSDIHVPSSYRTRNQQVRRQSRRRLPATHMPSSLSEIGVSSSYPTMFTTAATAMSMPPGACAATSSSLLVPQPQVVSSLKRKASSPLDLPTVKQEKRGAPASRAKRVKRKGKTRKGSSRRRGRRGRKITSTRAPAYTKEERRARIAAFLKKRKKILSKPPNAKYADRKKFADRRPRVGGRFVKLYKDRKQGRKGREEDRLRALKDSRSSSSSS